MRLLREIKSRARLAAPQVLAACTVAYFAYHALHGDRGFYAWIMLKQERAQVMATAETVAGQRAELERRVSLLRTAHLDPDMLEERAQVLLNYGAPNDHIIFLSPDLQRHDSRP